jgi:cyanophycin synthetase
VKVIRIRALNGPNMFADFPVLRMTLDLEGLADTSSKELPGLTAALLQALPGLSAHRCSRGYAGGFVERLHEGTYLGHIVEHVALELSGPCGIEVGFGKTVYGGRHGVYDVVVEFEDEAAMRVLLEAAVQLCNAIIAGERFDLAPVIAQARSIADARRLGPSTSAIVRAATRRNIPWRRLNDQSLLMLGYGARRKLVQATITGQTPHIAVDIAGDKHLTKDLLATAGLPVPEGRVVRTEDDAVAAYRELGGACAVKPLDANQGRGVSLALASEDEVRAAFRIAKAIRPRVVVERYVTGRNFRVMVVAGRVVAAAEREPAHVIGDGQHTIAELIALENGDPARCEGHSGALSRIEIDEVVLARLAKHGRALDDVLVSGERYDLRDSVNLSTGGTATDVTDIIHVDTRLACERAARVVGLDVCGVDLVCDDIAKPLTSQGAIIELNAAPGIRMHEHPSAGQARRVGEAIVASLFAEGETGRIPIISVTGTNGKTSTTRMIAHVLGRTRCVGATTTSGVMIGGRTVRTGDLTGPGAANMVLFDPGVELAVLETARGGIVRRGLGYDWSDVGVITNIQADHLGQDGLESIEDIFRVKKIVAERVREGGTLVLNAEDPRLAQLPSDDRVRRIARKVAFFALDPRNAVLRRHVQAGGIGYTVADDCLVEQAGDTSIAVARLDEVPATLFGAASFAVANALAAVAACRAYGASVEEVRLGLSSFRNQEHNPGRLNLYRVRRGYAVVDYGHNIGAYEEACKLAKRLAPCPTAAVISVPGDRPDALIKAIGRTVARGFDRFAVKDDDDRRGRKCLEVPGILAEAILDERALAVCTVSDDEQRAIRQTVATMREREVVFIFTDQAKRTAAFLEQLGGVPVERIDEAVALPQSVRLAG